MPPELIEEMARSPWWGAATAIAHTMPYDFEVVGRGGIPAWVSELRMPTLVLDGDASDAWRETVDALASSMPDATRVSITGQAHDVAPDVLAPTLRTFFRVPLRCARHAMAANPLSDDEQAQIARAKAGDFTGLRARDEHGNWITL